MTDMPVPEPTPSDPLDAEELTAPPVRPSRAEGGEEDAGPRPPRPSQAEGERDGRSDRGA